MNQFIEPGLIANAATLGVHWIYDVDYLKKTAKKKSLLFLSQEKEDFDQADPSFYVYPHNEIGDVSVQGDILIWLYNAVNQNPDFKEEDYSKLLFEKFKPGGDYIGYVEKYAKKLVMNVLAKDIRVKIENPMNDDHLVNFIPYLVCKALDLDNEQAWSLTKVLTDEEDFKTYFSMFDALIERIPEKGMQAAIESVIELAPEKFQEALQKAIEMKDTNQFIKDYAGRACPIKHAVPLIMHILYHTKNYKEAIELNALMGGASSDRGLLLGVFMNMVSEVPKAWIEKTKSKLTLQHIHAKSDVL